MPPNWLPYQGEEVGTCEWKCNLHGKAFEVSYTHVRAHFCMSSKGVELCPNTLNMQEKMLCIRVDRQAKLLREHIKENASSIRT